MPVAPGALLLRANGTGRLIERGSGVISGDERVSVLGTPTRIPFELVGAVQLANHPEWIRGLALIQPHPQTELMPSTPHAGPAIKTFPSPTTSPVFAPRICKILFCWRRVARAEERGAFLVEVAYRVKQQTFQGLSPFLSADCPGVLVSLAGVSCAADNT